MPQRSNEFQELVDIIQRHFAPPGSVITTSAMVKSGDGSEREIDILIEFNTGLYPVKIAVEAKDHGRALDVTAIEQYIGKYDSAGGIRVNQVVIVARKFTKPAVKRAQLLGFKIHTLNSLKEPVVGQFEKLQADPDGAWWVSDEAGKEKTVKSLC